MRFADLLLIVAIALFGFTGGVIYAHWQRGEVMAPSFSVIWWGEDARHIAGPQESGSHAKDK